LQLVKFVLEKLQNDPWQMQFILPSLIPTEGPISVSLAKKLLAKKENVWLKNHCKDGVVGHILHF